MVSNFGMRVEIPWFRGSVSRFRAPGSGFQISGERLREHLPDESARLIGVLLCVHTVPPAFQNLNPSP